MPAPGLNLSGSLRFGSLSGMSQRASGQSARSAGPITFGVLGPLEVRRGGELAGMGTRRQRKVLGLLLLEPGQWLSADRLIELLWLDENPPRTARNVVQVCVSRLRALLGDGVPLLTAGGGYRLEVDPGDIDAGQFQSAVQRAEGAADAEAADLLRSALALWRGPVLAGTFEDELRLRLCGGLEEARLAATENRMDAELRLGRHGQVTSELTDLVAAHPTRERFIYQLMLALYRDGQASRALEIYRLARARLTAELGIDPGAGLQGLEVAILRNSADLQPPKLAADTGAEPSEPEPGAPAGELPAAPAQLPAPARGFTGRDQEIGWLDELAQGQGSEPLAGRVAVLAGTGGIGKTALAVQWAHRAGSNFPDGQLFADLHGYATQPPARPIDVLARFLQALGVDADQIPHSTEAAAAAYRTRLAGRRVLIILDNAADADQVRPLLPGSPSCMTIVTSRSRLTGLIVRDAALPCRVTTLSASESRLLLARIVGDTRLAAETDAVSDLAGLCGGLPLALRIAGAHLTEQPHRSIGDYAEALRAGNRVAALAVTDDEHSTLTTTFDLSYRRLDDPSRRLFRLLSLVPGTDLTAPAAAALMASSAETAERLLRHLAAAHLCEETAAGRFTAHDLLRAYGAGKSQAEDTGSDRAAAVGRLFSWYLYAADAAGTVVSPRTVRLPLPPADADTAPAAFADRQEALDWLEAERSNLIAAVRHAAVHGPREIAWLLPDALDGYLGQQGHTIDRFTAARASLATATGAADAPAMAAAQIILGRAHHAAGEDEQARSQYQAALRTAGELSWPQARATALVGLGAIAGSSGPLQDALNHFTEALAIRRAAGTVTGQADLLANIGRVCVDLAELDRAVDCCQQALALYQREHSPRESHGWFCLGCAQHASGDLAGARECFDQARQLDHELGTVSNEARELAELAAVALDAGRSDETRALVTQAVAMAREAADPEIECIATLVLADASRRGREHQLAARQYRSVLRIAGAHGIRLMEGPALVGLGFTSLALGQAQQAGKVIDRALAVRQETGHRLIEAAALRARAGQQLLLGRLEQAAAVAEEALALTHRTGQRLEQVRVLLVLTRISQRAGDREGAAAHWRTARDIAAELGAPEASEPAPG